MRRSAWTLKHNRREVVHGKDVLQGQIGTALGTPEHEVVGVRPVEVCDGDVGLLVSK